MRFFNIFSAQTSEISHLRQENRALRREMTRMASHTDNLSNQNSFLVRNNCDLRKKLYAAEQRVRDREGRFQ